MRPLLSTRYIQIELAKMPTRRRDHFHSGIANSCNTNGGVTNGSVTSNSSTNGGITYGGVTSAVARKVSLFF